MNLSHWFVPKVGIFYKHKEWADKVFKQIEDSTQDRIYESEI